MPRATLPIALVVAVSLTSACVKPVPGTLMHTARNPRLATEQRFTLAIAPPVDRRPKAERQGDDPKTSFFFTLIFLWWNESRGNWVSNDFQTSENAAGELAQMTAAYLGRTGLFKDVQLSASGADFLLESEILHLYGTHYAAKRTVISISRSSWGSGVRTADKRFDFAVYGNAIVRYRLYDTRGGQKKLVWKRSIRGSAQLPPGPEAKQRLGVAAHRATRRALASLSRQLTRALSDYGQPPFDREVFERHLNKQSAANALRFVVQRVSKRRTATELLTIAHPAGRVVDHRIVHDPGVPTGRPGDWLLSRQRPDGTLMPYKEYAALAAWLSRSYDLRRVDEIYHYHFFGRRKDAPTATSPSPTPAAPASKPSTPSEPGAIDIHGGR